jgi:hypothetical protein
MAALAAVIQILTFAIPGIFGLVWLWFCFGPAASTGNRGTKLAGQEPAEFQ